jgi:hypothetical protein
MSKGMCMQKPHQHLIKKIRMELKSVTNEEKKAMLRAELQKLKEALKKEKIAS